MGSSGVNPENLLFQQWRGADEGGKQKLLPLLVGELRKHAKAIIWNYLKESSPELESLAVWKAVGEGYKFNETSLFSTWFHRVVTNLCLDHIRKQQSAREIPLEEESGVFTQELSIIEKLDLQKLYESLDEEQKELMDLLLQGHTYQEIGELRGVSPQSVKQKLMRLQGRMRRLLNGRV